MKILNYCSRNPLNLPPTGCIKEVAALIGLAEPVQKEGVQYPKEKLH